MNSFTYNHKNSNNNSIIKTKMNKKMNSTEALSKKFSRINIPNSVSRQNTPNRRPASSQKKIGK